MLKAYKFRIEPTAEQASLFIRTFGCVRFVWNYMLALRRQEYLLEGLFAGKNLCSSVLTQLKKDEAYQWLNEVDSTALQATLEHQLESYNRFFRKEGGLPRFKSKKQHFDSYTSKFVNGNIRLNGNMLRLPKAGNVRLRLSRRVEGRIQRAIVSRNPSGKWFVSILCEKEEGKPLPQAGRDAGIDVGISDFAVLDNGAKYEGPHALRKDLEKLRREQQALSRKTRGSHRYEAQRLKVARLHERVANIRADYAHQLSIRLVREYDRIAVEDLSVQDMLKTSDHTRARGIMDSGWSDFVKMLEYKSAWYGRMLVKVGTYFPSSQLCSVCGHKDTALKDTRIRSWRCPRCGTEHDRDINAAINIKKEGIRLLSPNPC